MEHPQIQGSAEIWHRTVLFMPVPSLRSYAPAYWVGMVCFLFWAISILQLPLESFLRALNVDDSFYYYVIARNFAHGLWSTFDSTNPTNGYHPLWAFLLTPVFAFISDPVAALRAAKLLEGFCLLGSALCILALGRRAGWNWIIASIVPLWLFTELIFFSGMESSPQILVLSLALLFTALLCTGPNTGSFWIALTLVCALMPWVRLELIAAALTLAAGVTAYTLWRREWNWPHLLLLWGGISAGFLAYLAYNQLVFGTPLPVSGQIKNYWSALRIANDENFSFAGNAIQFLKMNWKTSFAALILMGGVAACWSMRAYRDSSLRVHHAIDVFLAALCAAHFSRLIYSMLTMHAIYDFEWYYISSKLLVVLLIPVAASRLILFLRLSFNFTRPWMELILATSCLILALAIQNPLKTRADLDPRSLPRDWEIASYEGTQWMNQNLPAGARIGSADAGVLGYFSAHQVINLDGLVNSAAFFKAVQNQAVSRWIKEAGITHFAGGMEAGATDGCAYMARASVQKLPIAGQCREIYAGTPFKAWFGRELDMQFKVFEFTPQSGN